MSAATRPTDGTARRAVWLVALIALCATLRVGFAAASFPFFNHVDELGHADKTYKALRGKLLASDGVEFERDLLELFRLYNSPCYIVAPDEHGYPPLPAEAPKDLQRKYLDAQAESGHPSLNHQVHQPPHYYLGAGAVLAAARALGLSDIPALYCVRWLSAVLYGLGVVFAWRFVKLTCPGRPFLWLGVPLLMLVFPQDVFYGISNDVPAVCLFPLALELLYRLRNPGAGLPTAALTGVSIAVAFLIKQTNVALVFAAAAMTLPWTVRAIRARDRRAIGRAAALALGAAIPVIAWYGYKLAVSGDVTGLATKSAMVAGQVQTWDSVWAHPLWTLPGIWTFGSHLVTFFWRGELFWHGEVMRHAPMDWLYLGTTLLFGAVSLWASLRRAPDRLPDSVAAACWAGLLGGAGLLAVLSMSIDFGDNFYPSSSFPYFVSGRLLCGLIAPLLLIYLDGLWRLAALLGGGGSGGTRLAWILLGALLLAILVSESVLMAPVVQCPHNLWHLRV